MKKPKHLAALVAFAAALTFYAGAKHGRSRFTFDAAYLADAGSYATNDTAHIAIASRIPGLDVSACDVLAYCRSNTETNAPMVALATYTFAEYPRDFAIPGATNYDYFVYLDYVPPPNVHTNGVYNLYGIPLDGDEPRAAFPNTTLKKEEEE